MSDEAQSPVVDFETMDFATLKAMQDRLNQTVTAKATNAREGAMTELTRVLKSYPFTPADINKARGIEPKAKTPKTPGEAGTGGKVAPKYRDPATGLMWTGRGKPPVWIRDEQDRSRFLINDTNKPADAAAPSTPVADNGVDAGGADTEATNVVDNAGVERMDEGVEVGTPAEAAEVPETVFDEVDNPNTDTEEGTPVSFGKGKKG